MSEWKKADWFYIKGMYIRHIGIEIEGKLYLVDLMPSFTGLLSFPQIHWWQRLPVYQAKDDESQKAMRKLKLSKAGVNKSIKREQSGAMLIAVAALSLAFPLKPLFERLAPWLASHINKMIIPGVLGIIVAILGYLAIFFLLAFLLGSTLHREIQTYEPAPFRISISYKQKFSYKLRVLCILIIAGMVFPAVYFGLIEPFGFSVLAMFVAVSAHVILPKTEIWYKIRPNK